MLWENLSSNKAKQGRFFVLKAANGEPIGKSEIYSSEAAAKNGVESVKKNAAVAQIEDQTVEGWKNMTNPVFELYKDKAGEFRFRLRAKNGEPILSSEGYSAKASAIGGIERSRKTRIQSSSRVIRRKTKTSNKTMRRHITRYAVAFLNLRIVFKASTEQSPGNKRQK
jgi:uncharacterized protein YegP (UPF0339 family)